MSGTSDNAMSSAASATAYPDSDSDLQLDLTSPVYPQEEGEVSDCETEMSEQESDQQISEEQSYRERPSGVCILL